MTSLYDQMAQEAQEFNTRRKGSHKRSEAAGAPLSRSHGSNFEVMAERASARAQHLHEAQSRIVDRDPCGTCNVRKDAHDEFGCKRWRPSL